MPCGRCNGTGYEQVYDTVEYWGANVSMPTWIACRMCLERGICPVCDEEKLVFEPSTKSKYLDLARCTGCGWQEE